MTKQEAIRQVYGFLSEIIDNDGWAYYGVDKNSEYGIEPFGEYETRNNKDGYYEWRPKSLQGIENNNGWIKIKTKSDLPKTRDKDDVFILDCDGRIVIGCTMLLSDKEIRNFWLATVTHYKPIIKPQLPIY